MPSIIEPWTYDEGSPNRQHSPNETRHLRTSIKKQKIKDNHNRRRHHHHHPIRVFFSCRAPKRTVLCTILEQLDTLNIFQMFSAMHFLCNAKLLDFVNFGSLYSAHVKKIK